MKHLLAMFSKASEAFNDVDGMRATSELVRATVNSIVVLSGGNFHTDFAVSFQGSNDGGLGLALSPGQRRTLFAPKLRFINFDLAAKRRGTLALLSNAAANLEKHYRDSFTSEASQSWRYFTMDSSAIGVSPWREFLLGDS
jgi:hypothetical protein